MSAFHGNKCARKIASLASFLFYSLWCSDAFAVQPFEDFQLSMQSELGDPYHATHIGWGLPSIAFKRGDLGEVRESLILHPGREATVYGSIARDPGEMIEHFRPGAALSSVFSDRYIREVRMRSFLMTDVVGAQRIGFVRKWKGPDGILAMHIAEITNAPHMRVFKARRSAKPGERIFHLGESRLVTDPGWGYDTRRGGVCYVEFSADYVIDGIECEWHAVGDDLTEAYKFRTEYELLESQLLGWDIPASLTFLPKTHPVAQRENYLRPVALKFGGNEDSWLHRWIDYGAPEVTLYPGFSGLDIMWHEPAFKDL